MVQTKLKFMLKVTVKDGGAPTITKIGMLLNQLRHEEGSSIDSEISRFLEEWLSSEHSICEEENEEFVCSRFLAAVELIVWADEEAPSELYFYPFTSESLLKVFMNTFRVEHYNNRRRHWERLHVFTTSNFTKLFYSGNWILHNLFGMRFFLPGFTYKPTVVGDDASISIEDTLDVPGSHADFIHSLRTSGGKIKSYRRRFKFQRRNINFRRRVKKQKFEDY